MTTSNPGVAISLPSDQNQTQTPFTEPTPEQQSQPTLYFAYGSNLSTTQMLQRCPTSTIYSPSPIAFLPGYRWVISPRGFANLLKLENHLVNGALEEGEIEAYEEKKEHGVYGLLYTLTPDDEALLDCYEGVPYSYYKATMDVELFAPDVSGTELPSTAVQEMQTVKALVYIDPREGTGVCRDEYRVRLRRGLGESVLLGLPREGVVAVERWL